MFGYGGARAVTLLVGLIFTAIGVLFSVIFAGDIPSDVAILTTGRPAEGRVVSAVVDTSTAVNGRHPIVIRFEYTVAGKRFRAESSTIDASALALAPAEAVPIEVASIRPTWARMAGTTRSWAGYFGAFVFVFPVVGVVVMAAAMRGRRRAVRAFVHGRPTMAKVVFAGWDEHYSINGRNPFKLAWEFRAADGAVYRGSLSSMNSTDLEPFAKDGEVVVLYLPNFPQINTLFVAGTGEAV